MHVLIARLRVPSFARAALHGICTDLLPSLSRFVLLPSLRLQLRVAQVTGGTASKVGKIKTARKNIARVLTVLNQKARQAMREEIAAACNGNGAKRIPKQLRQKKTRAIRRQMTPAQKAKKTVKVAQKTANFALRRFAISA